MKKVFFAAIAVLLASCATTHINDVKRNSPVIVDNVRYNNNYNPNKGNGMYIVTGFRKGDCKKFVYITNDLHQIGDTLNVYKR